MKVVPDDYKLCYPSFLGSQERLSWMKSMLDLQTGSEKFCLGPVPMPRVVTVNRDGR